MIPHSTLYKWQISFLSIQRKSLQFYYMVLLESSTGSSIGQISCVALRNLFFISEPLSLSVQLNTASKVDNFQDYWVTKIIECNVKSSSVTTPP